MSNVDNIYDTKVDRDTMGNRIVRARESAAMSQGDLARHLGVRKKTVEGWEADRSEPRAHLAMRMAGILSVTPTWLIGGFGEAPSEEVVSLEIRSIRNQLEQMKEFRQRTDEAIASIEATLDRMVVRDNK